MREHNLLYYPCASFTNVQLPLLKVAALYFDKVVIIDPVGAGWAAIGADHHTRDTVKQFVIATIANFKSPGALAKLNCQEYTQN